MLPHMAPPHALPALAAAHAHVEAALCARLEARVPCLTGRARAEAEHSLIVTRTRAAVLTDANQPGTGAREIVELLGAEIVEPDESEPQANEDVVFAATFARTQLAAARGKAGEAHLELDRVLAAWPPDATQTDAACAAHDAISDYVLATLTDLAAFTRVAAARGALAAAGSLGVAKEAEAAARAEAEAEHLAAARANATRAGRLQARADTLAAVARLEAAPADGHTQRLVLDVLNGPFSPAPTVRAFNAFRGAASMPEVRRARAAELKQVGPLRIGTPVEVANLPALRISDWPTASLSACGVLCVGGRLRSEALSVAHLPTRRTAAIACEAGWAHGFVHGRELFVAQLYHDTLWHAPVAAVLAGRTDLADFEKFALAAEWGSEVRLDAAPVGWVAAAVPSNASQHMVVDLATRTSRVVNVGRELSWLGGFAGIAVPGAAWAASDYSPNVLLAVAPDGATRQIADGTWQEPTVLPSAAAPADLARAAVLDWRGAFSVSGTEGKLRDPVRPHYYSLVRLHRDVFLCWDARSEAWAAARIVVP